MGTAALYSGAYLAGYLLPELLMILGARTDIRRIPLGINVFAAVACVLLVFGLRNAGA